MALGRRRRPGAPPTEATSPPTKPGSHGGGSGGYPAACSACYPSTRPGYHRRGTGETVLDRVVSSYTPTVRALAHARDHAAEWAPRRTLIVAMPTTPGQLTLPSVMAEADMLRRRLPSPTRC